MNSGSEWAAAGPWVYPQQGAGSGELPPPRQQALLLQLALTTGWGEFLPPDNEQGSRFSSSNRIVIARVKLQDLVFDPSWERRAS